MAMYLLLYKIFTGLSHKRIIFTAGTQNNSGNTMKTLEISG